MPLLWSTVGETAWQIVDSLFWLGLVTSEELAEKVAYDHVCVLWKPIFLQSSELFVVYWDSKLGSHIEENAIVQLGENKGTDKSFGSFSSQVLVDIADASDFHISRMADSWNVLVKSRVIWNETRVQKVRITIVERFFFFIFPTLNMLLNMLSSCFSCGLYLKIKNKPQLLNCMLQFLLAYAWTQKNVFE